jgi:Ca2+-binding EF-hand superfamily protein
LKDIAPLIKTIPIYLDVTSIFTSRDPESGDKTEVDFRQMLNVIVAMRDKHSQIFYRYLFKMYDQDGDGVLKEEEIVAVLYKISSQSLKAMSKTYLEGLVR